jgi:putative protease
MDLPELLAPLNNWKSISPVTKVLDYADAVYFGLNTNFSMRARADNFELDEIPKLMQSIHDHGKKGYLTTNIIIYNQELAELHQTIEFAKSAGVDAIICHDIASIMIAKDLRIPFHISTQANISNKISAKFYQMLGAERIILARELPLTQIKDIISEIQIPVECFIHGAMCTAISGRCYFSAELMGNDDEFSANRGKCVQPCRRWWTLSGEEGEKIEYDQASGMFFNAKDLCMIGHLPALLEAGIKSFKIEGRMRDPLYLMETIACYREAMNAIKEGTYTPDQIGIWMKRLEKVFNRGFHTGFYFKQPEFSDINLTTRGNVSPWSKEWIGKVKNSYRQAKAIEVEMHTGEIRLGDEIIIENQGDFFYRQIVQSLRLENEPVEKSGIASANKHIFVGIAVDVDVPTNAQVYVYKPRE